MARRISDALLAASRRVQFKGKATLLDQIGLGPSNRDLVPPGVDSVACIDGVQIRTTRPRDVMFRELYINGLYQDDVLVALEHLLRPGDVFWDVGANYGFMTVWAHRRLGGRVRITSFEPNPVVLKELRGNLELNHCDDVLVEELCLSDREGEVRFFTSEDQSWNATMVSGFAEAHEVAIEVRARSTTIDRYVLDHPEPSVIKLDVEGAEPFVIAGGREFLARSRVSLVVEYNVQALAATGYSGDQYLDLFRQLGFGIELLKRPVFGRHRWGRRLRVQAARELPPLCNLVVQKA